MDNTVAIVIPYFGKLPNWMDLFLMSAAENAKIDFLIFTDDTSIHNLSHAQSSNIKIYDWTFSHMQNIVKQMLNGVLPKAYKLCDYKPCYGFLFKEFLKEYEYWGHCDVDTVLGNIFGFLVKVDYKNYDRLFLHGHFILYKNNQEMNELFKAKRPKSLPPSMQFDFVRQTGYVCHYDELAMNLLCSYYEKRFCKEEIAYDVSYDYKPFRLSSTPQNFSSCVTFEHGAVYGYIYDGKNISKKEYGYVHFMRRKFPAQRPISKQFAITHKGFIDIKSQVDAAFIQQTTGDLPVIYGSHLAAPTRSILQKIRDIIKLDWSNRGFLSFITVYHLIKSIWWIRKNGGDAIYDSPWFQGNITYLESKKRLPKKN